MMTNLFPSTRRESGFGIAAGCLVAIGFLIFGGSDAPETKKEMVGGPTAADTSPETPTPASKMNQEPVDDGYGPTEPLEKQPEPAAPEASVFVASDETVITGAGIIEGNPDGTFRPSDNSVPLPLPDPVAEPPKVLAEISVDGTEYTKFVSFKVLQGDQTKMSAVARTLLTNVGGVEHTNAGTEGDIVVFSREKKPDQTVTRITVTDQGVTVAFRKEPTQDQLKSVQATLVAAANLGVTVGKEWKGEGASRTLKLVAATDKK